MRKAVFLVGLVIACLGVQGADESLWFHCDVGGVWFAEGEPYKTFEGESLFVTVNAKSDNNDSKKLNLTIWSNFSIGTEAFYSWSEGSQPDDVSASVGETGWRASALRSQAGGTLLSREISIERRTGAFSSGVTETRDGVVVRAIRKAGVCRKTGTWVDR